MKLLEADVTKQCLDLARYAGFEAIRLQSGRARPLHGGYMTLNRKGTPDWLLIRPTESGHGDIAYLELKRLNREPEPHQLAVHEELRNRGFLVAVIDSAEAMKRWLETEFAR